MSWALLGPSLLVFKLVFFLPSWDCLGPSWGCSGGVLEPSWAVLLGSWAGCPPAGGAFSFVKYSIFGLGSVLGPSWAVLGRSGVVFGRSGSVSGPSLAGLGPF